MPAGRNGTSNGHAAAELRATFARGGFGTRTLLGLDGSDARPTPPVVSRRGALRYALPAIYQDSDFAMRFVQALEEVLDPVVATLDGLHHYVGADHAPRAALQLLSSWMGIESDEAQATSALREQVREAANLGKLRGTRAGMELALRLAFPDLPLRVEDGGAITWPGAEPLASGAATFAVYCDTPIPEAQQALVARCIEREKPVHTTFRLRVKAAKKKAE